MSQILIAWILVLILMALVTASMALLPRISGIGDACRYLWFWPQDLKRAYRYSPRHTPRAQARRAWAWIT